MKVTLFANCQADGVAHFIRQAYPTWDVQLFHNYQIILGEQTTDQLRESASKCDLLIFQPTSETKYGDMSAEYYAREVVPAKALKVSFGYMYSLGFFPLIGHGDAVIGTDDLRDTLQSLTLDQTLATYDRGDFDFRLWPRHLHCAAEQAKREVHCDVKMSEWMMENRRHRLLLTFNHPASVLFAELTRRIMARVGLPLPNLRWTGPNDCNLPCTVPVSRYVIEHYGWQMNEDPEAHKYYRELLSLAWHKVNP